MQNKPQRRIFIFVKSIDGGTGTFVLSLQKIPKYIKNEVLVKTFVVENPIYRTVKNESFEYCRSNSSSSPSKYAFSMDNILAFFGNLVWYIRKVKDYDPDVIISVDIYCNIIVLIAKFSLFLRNNVIITTHNNLFDTLHLKGDSTVEWSVSKLVRLLYARADYLVVVSKGIRKSFQRKFKLRKNMKVIEKRKNGSIRVYTVNWTSTIRGRGRFERASITCRLRHFTSFLERNSKKDSSPFNNVIVKIRRHPSRMIREAV